MSKLITFALYSLGVFVLCIGPSFAQGRTAQGSATPQAKPTRKADASAEAFFSAGMKCSREDYDCQISNFTKAINLELNTKAVFRSRGNAYMSKKEYAKAISDFSKAIELDKNDARSYKDRGKAIYGMAQSNPQLDAAIQDFTSAIELEPSDAESFKFRGTAYFTRTRFDEAKSDLDKALSLTPDDADIIDLLSQVRQESAKVKKVPGSPLALTTDAKLAELEAWAKVKNSVNGNDYWVFLQNFPTGAFSKIARDKMFEIGDPEWNRVKAAKDPYQYREYLKKYPDGPFSGLAREEMKVTTDAMIEWESLDIKNPQALAAFVKKYPTSKYVDEVKAKIAIEEPKIQIQTFRGSYGVKMWAAKVLYPGLLTISPTKIQFVCDGDKYCKTGTIIQMDCPMYVKAVAEGPDIRDIKMQGYDKYRIVMNSNLDAVNALQAVKTVCSQPNPPTF